MESNFPKPEFSQITEVSEEESRQRGAFTEDALTPQEALEAMREGSDE